MNILETKKHMKDPLNKTIVTEMGLMEKLSTDKKVIDTFVLNDEVRSL